MKLHINDSIFSEYTPESAYWAGFTAADGSVDTKYRFRFYLSLKDVGHLYKLKHFLGAEHKVSENEKRDRCSFELTNKKIVNDLNDKYNIIPNKSYILTYPLQMPRELDSHFIRGYWDGDGTLCESFSNKNSTTATYYAAVVGSELFILDMVVLLEDYIGHSLPAVRDHINGINATFKMNTNAAIWLSNFMYKNSTDETRLSRKYNIYKQVVLNNKRTTR